jgi:hypothetical protein
MRKLEFDVEALECRQMLAGNVTVRVVGGDLVINGDQLGNEIVIRASAITGQFSIQGIGGTTVENTNAIIVQGVADDVRMNLRNGDNTVLLTAFGLDNVCHNFFVDDFRVTTGNGNDIVELDNVNVGGNIRISTRTGDDVVFVHDTDVQGVLNISTARGDDTVELTQSMFSKRANVNLAAGNDALNSDTTTFADNFSLRMGADTATVGHVQTMVLGNYFFASSGNFQRITSQFTVDGTTRFRADSGSGSGYGDPIVARAIIQSALSTQPGLLEADLILVNYGC